MDVSRLKKNPEMIKSARIPEVIFRIQALFLMFYHNFGSQG
ncbi:hypothetical protein C1A50_4934 [Paenibacillus polymyxa]|nr:hypothetical protein C1A50_4934 [Paenibacillus polymyxa]